MEQNREDLDNLIDEVKDYLETRSKLGKLQAIDKGSQVAADSATMFFLVIICILFLLFISVAVALALSSWIEKTYSGFLLVSFFYLILGIILYIKRNSWIRKPIINSMIKNFLKDSEYEN